MLPGKFPGENSSLYLLASGLQAFFGYSCDMTSSTSISSWLSLLLHVSLLFVSLISTLVIGFRAHLNHPAWSHLQILNSVMSAKTLSPNKVMFTGLGHRHTFMEAFLEPVS